MVDDLNHLIHPIGAKVASLTELLAMGGVITCVKSFDFLAAAAPCCSLHALSPLVSLVIGVTSGFVTYVKGKMWSCRDQSSHEG